MVTYLVVDDSELLTPSGDGYSPIYLRGYVYNTDTFIKWVNDIWGDSSIIFPKSELIETVEDAIVACRQGGWKVLQVL